MKSKDQLLLEQAYQQIMFDNQIHQMFLTEAGLLDKAKQAGGAIVNKAKEVGGAIADKAKSMFGNSIDGLMEIIKKADPELFAKIQQAVQQKDEQTLQSIFKDPQVKQQQQQLAQESLLKEGVVDSVKNLYAKASNFLTERPDFAVKLALAGILTAMAAMGPEGLSHMAGALTELAARTFGGGAVGAAIGGAVGGIRHGWEGAKKGMKKGFGIGAGVGLASGTQNLMANGADNFDDALKKVQNFDVQAMVKGAEDEAAKEVKSKQDTIADLIKQAFSSIGNEAKATLTMQADQAASDATRDPAKQMEIIKKIIKATAEAVKGDGSSMTQVGMAARNAAYAATH
jgi:hypothetical protein